MGNFLYYYGNHITKVPPPSIPAATKDCPPGPLQTPGGSGAPTKTLIFGRFIL